MTIHAGPAHEHLGLFKQKFRTKDFADYQTLNLLYQLKETSQKIRAHIARRNLAVPLGWINILFVLFVCTFLYTYVGLYFEIFIISFSLLDFLIDI